jgi:hypothetical protein
MQNVFWICGRYIGAIHDGIVWDFVGVFSTEELAAKACDTLFYFIAPMTLDFIPNPTEREEMPGSYYPFEGKYKHEHKN